MSERPRVSQDSITDQYPAITELPTEVQAELSNAATEITPDELEPPLPKPIKGFRQRRQERPTLDIQKQERENVPGSGILRRKSDPKKGNQDDKVTREFKPRHPNKDK